MNLQLLKIFVIFTFCQRLSIAHDSTPKVYHCNSEACKLDHIHVTFDNPKFHITTPDGLKVTRLSIFNKFVQVITDDFCTALPSLQSIAITRCSVEKVDENAFHECKNLSHLQIFDNHIKSLAPNTLNQNKKLSFIDVKNNYIREIPNELFKNLENLRILTLSKNKLSYFPKELLRDTKNLKELNLDENRLLDLDVAGIVKEHPSFDVLWLTENDFECKRLKENLKFLVENATSVHIDEHLLSEKYRAYNVCTTSYKQYRGFTCLDETQWDKEVILRKLPKVLTSIEAEKDRHEVMLVWIWVILSVLIVIIVVACILYVIRCKRHDYCPASKEEVTNIE